MDNFSANTARDMGIRDQLAVVTGGGSGIGYACVQALLARGARVVAVDLKFGDAAAAAVLEPGAARKTCDIADEESVCDLFSDIATNYGNVDILINSAGVIEEVGRTVDQVGADWDRVMSVNAKGTFLCSREAGRVMVPRRSGTIVNIGSVAGLVGIPASNAYGPSKAAVAHMTRSLACEWARFGVRVNCVAPGYIDAPMARGLFDGDQEVLASALKRVPMARLGNTAEIADVVLFLCSSLSSYITGAILPVDGGWSAFGGPSR